VPREVKVWPRERLVEAQELLAKVPGTTVLLHDQQCAADKRRRWRTGDQVQPTKRILVNERVCEGCGDCNEKSQCLSVQPVETEFGRKTRIHQSSCNLDFTCVRGDCPSFIEVETAGTTMARRPAPAAPASPDPTLIVDAEHFSAHLIGIGGTGVVSANATLARAAALDGFRVRSLDLPGSAIKAGPVVSQLQVFREGEVEPAATIEPGEADLFLAFDLLGSMTPANLAPASARKTVVIGSSSVEPTGQMAVDPSVALPPVTELRASFDARSRAADNVYVDVAGVTGVLFGDQMAANALLMGVAFQTGAIPFSMFAMLEAFRESGVAVEQNLAAFAWGRALVSQPELVAGLGLGDRPQGGGSVPVRLQPLIAPFYELPDLQHRLLIRIEDLIAYQDLDCARSYAQDCASALKAVTAAAGDGNTRVLEGYVRGLHKLMAYKDEYEVARLMTLESARLALSAEFGEDARPVWKLHPPVLRAMGMKSKMSFGPRSKPVFQALAKMKRVRGTALDPFGHMRIRRLERLLVQDYRAVSEQALAVLDRGNVDLVVRIVESPELVRGYEHVKLAHVRTWADDVDEAASALGLPFRVSPQIRGLATVNSRS
jgi:indolepyruvate ferredoxin oxidoreductase